MPFSFFPSLLLSLSFYCSALLTQCKWRRRCVYKGDVGASWPRDRRWRRQKLSRRRGAALTRLACQIVTWRGAAWMLKVDAVSRPKRFVFFLAFLSVCLSPPFCRWQSQSTPTAAEDEEEERELFSSGNPLIINLAAAAAAAQKQQLSR